MYVVVFLLYLVPFFYRLDECERRERERERQRETERDRERDPFSLLVISPSLAGMNVRLAFSSIPLLSLSLPLSLTVRALGTSCVPSKQPRSHQERGSTTTQEEDEQGGSEREGGHAWS